VCEQGYWEPEQETFLRGTNVREELRTFESHMGESTYRLDPSYTGGNNSIARLLDEGGKGYSNPNYTLVEEMFVNKTWKMRFGVEKNGARYRAQSGDNGAYQGGYSCSVRSYTLWENEGGLFEHPNYYSRYMDRKNELDNNTYTHWEGKRKRAAQHF